MEPFEWAMCGADTDPLQVYSTLLEPYDQHMHTHMHMHMMHMHTQNA